MSAAIAWWIAHVAFWMLLVHGCIVGELRAGWAAAFLVFWALAVFGLPNLPLGAGLSPSAVAVLDIALVFAIFKGDVRIT